MSPQINEQKNVVSIHYCWDLLSLSLQVNVPLQYSKEVRQMLEADAISTDLHKLGPYFYESGIKLLGFETPDVEVIAETLIKVES